MRFRYNFDLILIKVDPFQSNFDQKINQRQFKDRISQLNNQNYQLKDKKVHFY